MILAAKDASMKPPKDGFLALGKEPASQHRFLSPLKLLFC